MVLFGGIRRGEAESRNEVTATRYKNSSGAKQPRDVKKKKSGVQVYLHKPLLDFLQGFFERWYTRRDSNPRPSTPEADALSS